MKTPVRIALCTFAFAAGACLIDLDHRSASAVQAADQVTTQRGDGQPQSVDPRLKISLFAEQPTIVTPTGLDVDLQGRVWALESNTHFPPDQYARHASDRLYVLVDTDDDGKADDVRVFADGFTHAMSVAVRSDDRGQLLVYVASRAAIWQLFDDDGDMKADRRSAIVRLETEGNYPHNGLAGFAFDALGWMYFGLGENLGAPYQLVGSDGASLQGGGEGGNVYRCRPDGKQLSRWATGFWNPHASCLDALGRLFTVDNDPDSRPPCRLLHVVEGGDYGYRFRNGRKGLHPFTAWDGELPGTLPMLAGTGEAPSGIVAYESDGLPPDYQGNLLATSWGDHRIERFRLQPRGVSFAAVAEPMVTGGEDFRPVGLAVAPDGSLYCTDWVKRDYKLHGFGRIWKISTVAPRDKPVIDVGKIRNEGDVARLEFLLRSRRLDVRRAAARALAASDAGRSALTTGLRVLTRNAAEEPPRSVRSRIEALWALERMEQGLADSPDKRLPETQLPETNLPAKPAGSNPQAARSLALGGPLNEVATAAQRLAPGDRQEFAIPPALIPAWLQMEPKQRSEAMQREMGSRPFTDPGLMLAVLEQTVLSDLDSARSFLTLQDPFLFAAAVRNLAQGLGQAGSAATDADPQVYANLAPRARVGWLLALRQARPNDTDWLPTFLRDPDPTVRQSAVQWVAEQQLVTLRPLVQQVLESSGVTPELFLATMAALQMLDGIQPQDIDKTPPEEFLSAILSDSARPAAIRALALRMLPDGSPVANGPLLRQLLKSSDAVLRLEAIRTLQQSAPADRDALLRSVASDDSLDAVLRAEAVLGLAVSSESEVAANRALLLELFESTQPAEVQREALRSLRRFARQDGAVRQAVEQWGKTAAGQELSEEVALALGRSVASKAIGDLLEGGEPMSGRRVFFHADGPGCSKCHVVNGRGGSVGPDLSLVARTLDRRKLAESVLHPSQEVAPQFTNWTFLLTDGRQLSGMILAENVASVRVGTSEGKVLEVSIADIEQRAPQKTSIMPAQLPEQMSLRELRDVLQFLASLK